MLSARDLRVSFDDRVLFEDLTVGVDAGERLALVGVNGVGKSTLLRILAGRQKPETGRVDKKVGARVGFLEQEPQLNPELTAHEAAAEGLAGLTAALQEYEDVGEKLHHASDERLLNRQHDLLAQIERLGGFDATHRVDKVLSRLGVQDPSVKVGNLSGGGRRRVALAALMVSRPDILLLDEPTNHLDISSIVWLKDELNTYPGAVVFITHDRAFLDDVATRVAELADRRIYVHGVSYADYLEGRLERMDQQARSAHKRDRLLARELSWLRAGTPARTTKQQARIKRAEELLANAPEKIRTMEARTQRTGRLAKTILEFQHVDLGYPTRTVVKDLSLILTEGMRVGIVGPNGAGKTTLLRAVLGEIPPLKGTIVLGDHTHLSYFDQHRESLDDELSLRDAVTNETHVDIGGRRMHVAGYLEGYLFVSDDLKRKVKSLSGGERNRLLLARLMLKGANLLLMDEPTNDLDHDTLGVLEQIVEDHQGCALISSHDRRFLDRVATHILALEPDGTSEFFVGNHEMFLALRAQRDAREAAAAAPPPPKVESAPARQEKRPPTKSKLSYKEQRELDGMEAAIMEAETLAAALEQETTQPDFYKQPGNVTKERLLALETAVQRVAALYARWEELGAKGGAV